MSEYKVNLDIFAGPLDLLLYLVRKEEVDIYDIPIAKITDQYLRYIEVLQGLDIDVAGDFLVMASTLMHIKSAMLLPNVEPDQLQADDLSDPRAELIHQLLEYKKFKDAANLLCDASEQQNTRFSRPETIIEQLNPNAEPQLDLDQVSVWDLLEAFDSLMQATGAALDVSHIKDDTPIDLYQIEILHRLQTEGPLPFERIFESKTSRIVMVGLFLALLELIRDKLIFVEQSSPLAPIYLRSLTDEPAEQAVAKTLTASTETGADQPFGGQPAQPQPESTPSVVLTKEGQPPVQALPSATPRQVPIVEVSKTQKTRLDGVEYEQTNEPTDNKQ